jgi:hypothetical protein
MVIKRVPEELNVPKKFQEEISYLRSIGIKEINEIIYLIDIRKKEEAREKQD